MLINDGGTGIPNPARYPTPDAGGVPRSDGDGALGGIFGKIAEAARAIIVENATAGRDASGIPSTRATIRDETSLSELAEKYGTTTQQLILLNKNNPSLFDLREGDTIRVPLNRSVVEVQDGDTLRSLSRTYGIPVDQIIAANGLAGRELPPPGTEISMTPGASYGLGTRAAANAYIADVKTLEHQWNSLEPAERLQAMQDAINERLAARGIPPVTLVVSGSGGGGSYDFGTHTIEVNSSVLSKDGITQEELLDFADTLYHEGRHAEQWFDMARIHLAEGRPAAELGMPRGILRAARETGGLDLDSDRGRFANAMYRSVYGAGAAHRSDVFDDLNDGTVTADDHANYRRLPEEADAWRVGGMISNLWYG